MIVIIVHGSNDLSRAILSFLDAVTFNFKTNSQVKLLCIKHIGRQNLVLMVCMRKMNNNVLNFQTDLTDIIRNHLNMTYDCYLECT